MNQDNIVSAIPRVSVVTLALKRLAMITLGYAYISM